MKENMSEFLKNAIKKGKVRPLEEAFELYPTDEEEHKGKLESYLNEENIVIKNMYGVNKQEF